MQAISSVCAIAFGSERTFQLSSDAYCQNLNRRVRKVVYPVRNRIVP